MRSTTSRRSSRADSRNCFAISEVETLSPVLDDMSFLARSRRWRSASLIRTERVCCCFALSELYGGFRSVFSGLSGNRKLAFPATNTFQKCVSKHIDRIHGTRYDVNPRFRWGPNESPQYPIRPAQEPRLAKSAWLAPRSKSVRKINRIVSKVAGSSGSAVSGLCKCGAQPTSLGDH